MSTDAQGGEAPLLSVIVTVTTGGRHVDRCLQALDAQVDPPAFEVLVPVDGGVADVERWQAAWPHVRFERVPGPSPTADDPGAAHLAYDRRRATGLSTARCSR